MTTPDGIRPISSGTVASFMRTYRELCPSVNDEVSVEVFAKRIGWPVASVEQVAEWCRDRALIDTDAGLGDEIKVIEGR